MAQNVPIVFEGLDRLQRVIANATSPAQQEALAHAITGSAQEVLKQSRKIVPVDTAALKNSGRVENLKMSSTMISIEITYGGAAKQYARVVHEDMTANHPRGGTAKYLEIPVMANRKKFFKSIIGRYARYFRKAGG
jgi:hypothetical protein